MVIEFRFSSLKFFRLENTKTKLLKLKIREAILGSENVKRHSGPETFGLKYSAWYFVVWNFSSFQPKTSHPETSPSERDHREQLEPFWEQGRVIEGVRTASVTGGGRTALILIKN